ncbi:DinB family protein [Paenibacillus methanolicus]|uniref:DinB family protein n=1 Tax=Paenibacillus methanolicus TaxID=582686 RepID=A0A5S5CJX0_9BACL|nr:DinB family protein [Paenibacillus methanolicus]TYP78891.1 DinB family protein [Paenibacillus methanolicus]
MKPDRMLSRFLTLSQHYITEMDAYTWDEFNRKPSKDSWSLGEMYSHVINTGFLQMQSLHACLHGPENREAKKTTVGKIVYLIGGIPPIRAKVPKSAEGTASVPADKQELIDNMAKLRRQMEEALPLVLGASPDRKVEHPYFGYINAKEWYHHIVMHVAHHLRQKRRVDAFLKR